MLLPIALLALAFQTGGASAADLAGGFPAFIPMPGVSPRGVAVDKVGNVFVSVGEVRAGLEYIQVRKFTSAGEQLFSVEIGQGTIGGLMVTADGDLYVALAAGSARGVYRMDRDGQIELLPGSNQIFFANGLAFDERGTLYVAESVSVVSMLPRGPGGIWRIPRGGQAELWMRDELLRGTGSLGQPVWIGANGIAYYHGNLYLTNTEKGTLMQIPVQKDGSVSIESSRSSGFRRDSVDLRGKPDPGSFRSATRVATTWASARRLEGKGRPRVFIDQREIRVVEAQTVAGRSSPRGVVKQIDHRASGCRGGTDR